jgi:hypothetical protein
MNLEEEMLGWRGFRAALRLSEREIFDEMFDACRLHASAGSMSGRSVLLDSMLISILLEQQKSIKRLREELERIKTRVGEPG